MTLVSPETDKDQKHGLIKRTAIHNNETVESDKRAMLDSELDTQGILLGKVEQCANCEETIGRLEKSYEFKGRIVCSQCYKRLV